jgi:ubiquinone/menaquinone biosynthesis C-methylase UbiE
MQHILEIWDNSLANRVLDVGAGEGSLLYQMGINRFGNELYGVEISESGIDSIKSKNIPNLLEVVGFDGYSIPCPDQYFDLAISIHVLEHVEHERLFLAELKRVDKNILIEIPLEHTLNIKRSIHVSRPYGHINYYTVETFSNLLEISNLLVRNKKIFSNTRELECLSSNNLKTLAKYYMRKLSLKILPAVAPNFMTYLCMAHCLANE